MLYLDNSVEGRTSHARKTDDPSVVTRTPCTCSSIKTLLSPEGMGAAMDEAEEELRGSEENAEEGTLAAILDASASVWLLLDCASIAVTAAVSPLVRTSRYPWFWDATFTSLSPFCAKIALRLSAVLVASKKLSGMPPSMPFFTSMRMRATTIFSPDCAVVAVPLILI